MTRYQVPREETSINLTFIGEQVYFDQTYNKDSLRFVMVQSKRCQINGERKWKLARNHHKQIDPATTIALSCSENNPKITFRE